MKLPLILSVVLSLLISTPSFARDFEDAYAVYAAGAEPCKHYTIAVKKGGRSQDYFVDWLIGYLSAFNVIMPETHNILGEMDFASAQGWLERHCRRYPNELFVNATARLTEVLYPMRYKSGLKKPAPKTPAKPKRKLSDIKIR
jgi:hypothetical protein